MPNPVLCICAACREMFAPGRIFADFVRRAAGRLSDGGDLSLTGKRKRYARLTMWVWAMRRTKQAIPKGKRAHVVWLSAFASLQNPEAVESRWPGAALDSGKPRKARRWVAKRLGIRVCSHCYWDKRVCGCWSCPECGDTFKASEGGRCNNSSCGKCERCCSCVECGECGRSVAPSHFCSDCSRCRECDPCRRERESIPWTERGGRRSKLKYHGEPTARHPRYVGTEIECGTGDGGDAGPNYLPLGKTLAKWSASCHSDGSISLGGGIEVATSPARGSALEQQIVETCDALVECHAKVDRSCGLHVHVDARDLKPHQVLGAVRLYAKVEPALYEIVAPSRRTNTYAKPWEGHFDKHGVFNGKKSATERVAALEVAVYGSKAEADAQKASPSKHGSRYHGLNLNALLLYGTIEFRLHQGTVNAKKILMWSAVCSAIVERATKLSEQEIQDLVGSPMEILLDTLGDDEQLKNWIDDRRAHFIKSVKLREGKLNRDNITPVEASER